MVHELKEEKNREVKKQINRLMKSTQNYSPP